MKTLTGNATTQKNSQGNEPINLLEIDFGGTTKYYSDRDITFDGHNYIGKVSDWGGVDQNEQNRL